MIKQYSDRDIDSSALTFHGDVAYIGSIAHVIKWNVETNAVERLDGYPGLTLVLFCHT
jgi:hypothetical protein